MAGANSRCGASSKPGRVSSKPRRASSKPSSPLPPRSGGEGSGVGGGSASSRSLSGTEFAAPPPTPDPSPPRASRAGGGEEASSRFVASSRFADASRFATSSLLPRVDARARWTAASPPERRSFELSGGGCQPPFFSPSACALSLPPPLWGRVGERGGPGGGAAVAPPTPDPSPPRASRAEGGEEDASLFATRMPVVDPTPASPRLIAGLSSSASAGPIGCTSGRCALDFGVLPGFLGLFGVFAIGRIWGRYGGHERAEVFRVRLKKAAETIRWY